MITKHEVFGAEQVGRLVKEPAFDHICPLLPLSAGEESVELMGQWVSVPQAQRMATRPDIALESVGSAALGSVMSSAPLSPSWEEFIPSRIKGSFSALSS